MTESRVEEAPTSRRVEIQMTERFYQRMMKHLTEMGESNVSAWARLAIAKQMREEEGDRIAE